MPHLLFADLISGYGFTCYLLTHVVKLVSLSIFILLCLIQLFFGRSVYDSRHKFGEILTTEAPVGCDVVIVVPDSGVVAALGYAAKAGVPFQQGKRVVVVDDSIVRGTTSSKSTVKIGHSKELPAIPEHLSDDGKDFVRQCLQQNPSSRPSVAQLLEQTQHLWRDPFQVQSLQTQYLQLQMACEHWDAALN